MLSAHSWIRFWIAGRLAGVQVFSCAVAAAVVVAVLALSAHPAAASEGYYRYPALSGERLVFAAEGDLWTVGIAGGLAQRLTSHPGEERFPAISPDGRTLAFSASYEGPTEVYTMPIDGGLPTRRTWEDESSVVVGFAPSGEVLYATYRYSLLPDPALVRLDLATGQRQRVPLNQASDGAYDSSGRILFFVRPQDHANKTKRYRGGTARNIWRFAEGDQEAVNLTAAFPGEHHSPQVAGERLYFVTDRDGTMNVWSTDLGGADLRQETFHSGWDVRSLAIDGSSESSSYGSSAVYQLGADLWRLDLASGSNRQIPITLASDFDQLREKWITDPTDSLTHWDLQSEGDAIALTVRGRVFVVPVKGGRRAQLERGPGVRLRDAVFLPGTDQILLLSDQTGELEFRVVPRSGVGGGREVTGDGQILRFAASPSPDGKRFAFSDKNEDLFVVEVANGETRRVNDLREGAIASAWSPDSRFLVWERRAENGYVQLSLWDREAANGNTPQNVALTSDRVNSRSATFSPDGKWLYFLSDRNLESSVGGPWGPRQPEAYFEHPMKLYAISLRAGERPPFRPGDELYRPEKAPDTKSSETKEPATSSPSAVTIDRDGLAERYWELPVRAGDYRGLATDGKVLYWLSRRPGPETKWDLVAVAIEPDPGDPVVMVEEVAGYQLSNDRKKLAVRKGDAFHVFEAKPVKVTDLGKAKVDLGGFGFPISVREDFRQIFVDAWRLERDYFYDPGMHGVDWTAVRDKYLPLVDRVTTRDELSDLIGEVVGELSALHISVRGGDLRRGPDRIRLGSLGARLRRDPAAGGEVIEEIYRADPDYPQWRSPLADPYLGIAEGDVIVAINGEPVLSVADSGVLLRNQVGRQVLLRLRSAGLAGSERDVVVMPLDDEADLRVRAWEHGRRLQVEAEGGGRLGYVHLRAMTGSDLSDWYRNFYPVFDRQGLIIDVRHNSGGNIDSLILEKLLRRAWFYWQGRVGAPYWNMQQAFRGHMVVLVDERTASDGEAFAEGFRRLGLGEVIGTRTWGGEIWLSNDNRLSDGGIARAPQTGVYGPEREWLIEGWGVEPDIVVDNLPHETFLGRDRQLEAAIARLEELIRDDPREVPPPPPFPDKAFVYPPPPAGAAPP